MQMVGGVGSDGIRTGWLLGVGLSRRVMISCICVDRTDFEVDVVIVKGIDFIADLLLYKIDCKGLNKFDFFC